VLDHPAVFASIDIHDGFAARAVRSTVPLTVEDNEIPVREDALDLNVALKDRLRVEGHCVGFVRFGHGLTFPAELKRGALQRTFHLPR
jgi:hypothetical protein